MQTEQALVLGDPTAIRLAGRAQRRDLGQDDGARIATLLFLLVKLLGIGREKSASIRRLRHLIFGSTRERRTSSTCDSGEKKSDRTSAAPRQMPPDCGRLSADDSTGATTVRVEHSQLRPGHPCPDGCGGRLFKTNRPAVSIQLEGGTILAATRFERAVLL